MKARQVAVVALGLAVAAGLVAYPAFASTGTQTNGNTTGGVHSFGHGLRNFVRGVVQAIGRGGHGQSAVAFTSGQAFTLTSTSGKYLVVGSGGRGNGTASGTLVFTVDGKLSAGYTVSLAGSITVGSNTYVISGSGVIGPGGQVLRGQGSLASSGSFILIAGAKGDFAGSPTGTALVDLSTGGVEYAVHLTGGLPG